MTVLTGLQANNQLHIGNYFGAILPIVKSIDRLSADDKLFYFVPNLHSFTMPIDHTQLYSNTLNNVRILLASGVDYKDERINLFRQSKISEHSELSWALQCFTYYGEASRMTQFKDKSLKNTNFCVALLTYPILMAADILLYDANFIPLGLDQQQHIELTRDIAQRFNNQFGDTFTVPNEWNEQLKFQGLSKGLKILSLSNPAKKMSKSDDDQKGCVFLTDTKEQITKKIMSAATDSLNTIKFNPVDQPGVSNLIKILSLVRECDTVDIELEFKDLDRYGDFKKVVAEELSSYIVNLQSNMGKYSDQMIDDILTTKESKVKKIANDKLQIVYKKLGL